MTTISPELESSLLLLYVLVDDSLAKEQLHTVRLAVKDSNLQEGWRASTKLLQEGWYRGQAVVSTPTLFVQLCTMT